MRLVTRTFLSIFLPVAGLLLGSFWALRSRVEKEVREDLRASVRQNQVAMARERARDQIQADRVLGIVAENPSLKAGLQLATSSSNPEARATLADQLVEIANSLSFDFLLISRPDGRPVAAVRRGAHGVEALRVERTPPANGFFSTSGTIYQVASGPVNQDDENLGQLTIGEELDLTRFGTPVVLLHERRIAASSEGLSAVPAFKDQMNQCGTEPECEFEVDGKSYLSFAMGTPSSGYELRSLQSFETASAPMNIVLTRVFVYAALAVLGAALAVSAVSSRAVARPIASVVAHLRTSEDTGILPDFPSADARIHEIRELAEGFNRAAMAIREGREELIQAYVAFTGSLAQALDARDPYTAGHSRRVSDYACAIAGALGVSGHPLDDLRIGALLHDIGKIGISDSILLKAGRLTPEEEELIKQHPVIGRRILEGVQGFHAYLDVVEFHHENWDGTGYPRGLKGEETPLAARIVKVADAYDAMTSDRPYRRGMTHEAALVVLENSIDSQFEARIVQALKSIESFREIGNAGSSLANLVRMVEGGEPAQEMKV